MKGDDEIDDTTAPLIEHLAELRTRLINSLVAFCVAMIAAFTVAGPIFNFLAAPLVALLVEHGQKPELIYTGLQQGFFTQVRISVFGGFVLAFPVISYQLWRFVAPGLYKQEKRAFLPFLLATPVLFISGASLAYFIVMPTAFKWLLAFQSEAGGVPVEALPAMGGYLDLVMRFILAFGISFLLPVLMLLLNRAGIVTREQFTTSRRFVIVGIFILAAIVTPPDVVSQLILALPMMALFEGSLLLMPKTKPPEEEKAEEAKPEELPSPVAAEAEAEPMQTPPPAS